MFHSLYLFTDEYQKQYYLNAKIGGFVNEKSAIAAIKRRSNNGVVTNSNNHVLFIIKNGVKIA